LESPDQQEDGCAHHDGWTGCQRQNNDLVQVELGTGGANGAHDWLQCRDHRAQESEFRRVGHWRQDKIRPLWRHYYQNTQGIIIFVVDSADVERMRDEQDVYDDDNKKQVSTSARTELHRLAGEDELHNVPILVLANKQDLGGALTVAQVTNKLGLQDVRDHTWYVQGTCAHSGQGLPEGMAWLSRTISKQLGLL